MLGLTDMARLIPAATIVLFHSFIVPTSIEFWAWRFTDMMFDPTIMAGQYSQAQRGVWYSLESSFDNQSTPIDVMICAWHHGFCWTVWCYETVSTRGRRPSRRRHYIRAYLMRSAHRELLRCCIHATTAMRLLTYDNCRLKTAVTTARWGAMISSLLHFNYALLQSCIHWACLWWHLVILQMSLELICISNNCKNRSLTKVGSKLIGKTATVHMFCFMDAQSEWQKLSHLIEAVQKTSVCIAHTVMICSIWDPRSI